MDNTIKTILLAAPPGQFDNILADLRSILAAKSTLLDQKSVSSIRSEWEASTGLSNLSAARSDDSTNNGCTKSLCKAMDEYLALKFSSPGVRAAHVVTAEDPQTLTITTYAERIDLHNNHAGSWKGCYTLCPTTGSLSGSISITAHTFENGGNVQLHSNFSAEAVQVGTCSPSDDNDKLESWSKAVTRQIQSWEENDVMEKLKCMYDESMGLYMKKLRRIMPLTRTKMEWNANAHKVLKTLGEGHEKEKFKH